MAGLKIEAIEEVGQLDRRIVAGRLAAVEPHPEADRVQVCRVEVGRPAPLVAVSGAPGLAAGQMVPVALPGARLPDGGEAQAVRIRGVESAGVLCSEAELALGEDASQVLVLPDDAAPGTPLAALPGITDTVLEAEVTPNRGDCLSVLGVAREVAAVSGARLRHPRPRPRESGTAAAREVRIRVEAADLCPRYCARVVRGVGIVPSPLWVRLRLRRAGMRALNAVVDATNYVMLERGQPLHAFDLERLAERRIVVRRGASGERLTTLDGVERTLEPDDLVIADGRGPVALAGVMGGEASEVTPATRVLLLESAFFAPASVRRTSRRLALPSQAAYRFERRVDPAMVPEALDAVAALIVRTAGGRVAPGIVEDAPGTKALAPPTIRLRPRRVISLLGARVARGEIARSLRALGAACRTQRDALLVTPPSFRGDLRLEEDLIEEVARVGGGYDRIPVARPEVPPDAGGARQEPRAVALLLTGAWPPRGVERNGPPVDFLDLKGVLGGLFAALGLDGERVCWRPAGEIDSLHPGKAALVELGGATLGVAGALHPTITQSADLPGEVWVAQLSFAELAHYVPRRLALRPLPRFPAVTRDLAVVVDEAFRAGDILEEIRALQNPHIEMVRLFDCYRGAPIAAGKKSLAYTIAYRAPDRTLTDEEVNALHAAVLQRLAGRFALEFRA